MKKSLYSVMLSSFFLGFIGCGYDVTQTDQPNILEKVMQNGTDATREALTLQNSRTRGHIVNINSVKDAENGVLDKILKPAAYLAHYLGYGWCGGTRSQYVGEDFYRTTNGWQARYNSNDPYSDGHLADQRLGLEMHNWDYEIVDVMIGDAVITEIEPLTLHSGTPDNSQSNAPSNEQVKFIYKKNKTVTDTRDFSFSWGTEIKLKKKIKFPFIGEAETEFTQSFSGTYSSGHSERHDFGVDRWFTDDFVIPPFQKLKYQVFLAQTKSTVPYTAKIRVKGNLEMIGFLRWGGGSRPGTNYHMDHAGSGDRPDVDYIFGDANQPFYEAINEQREYNLYPWLWDEMFEDHYNSVKWATNILENQNEYIFTITGKFTQVQGMYTSTIAKGVIADVKIYDLINFDGSEKHLQFYSPDVEIAAKKPNILYSMVDMGWNERMKSFKANVAPGWQVTFYEHVDGSGKHYVASGGETNYDFSNFLASSIRLELLGTTVNTSGDSGTYDIPNGDYKIICKHSNKILDGHQMGTGNGTNLVQYSDFDGTNQHWTITYIGTVNDKKQYKIKNLYNNLFIDVQGYSTSNGGNIHLWAWHGANNQRWNIEHIDGPFFRIVSVQSGQVLDVAGASNADGGNVLQWPWHGGNNQLWQFVPLGS